MKQSNFEWDIAKDRLNQEKHDVSFTKAKQAFLDPLRLIAKDEEHSGAEDRYYCFGEVDEGVMTVRFTHRASKIRIIGTGYWSKGKAIYEQENNLHR